MTINEKLPPASQVFMSIITLPYLLFVTTFTPPPHLLFLSSISFKLGLGKLVWFDFMDCFLHAFLLYILSWFWSTYLLIYSTLSLLPLYLEILLSYLPLIGLLNFP